MKKKKNKWEMAIGKRVGKILVLERVYNYRGKGIYLKCLCDCGTTTIKSAQILHRAIDDNDFISCGCVKKRDITILKNIKRDLASHYKVIKRLEEKAKEIDERIGSK